MALMVPERSWYASEPAPLIGLTGAGSRAVLYASARASVPKAGAPSCEMDLPNAVYERLNCSASSWRRAVSCAMVLAASPRVAEGEDSHGGPVELVSPPEDAKAGDRVFFEGWEGEPEGQLNPKKKIWETMQPGFTTTDSLGVGFDVEAVPQLSGEGADKKTGVAALKTAAGLCSVKTLKGATVR